MTRAVDPFDCTSRAVKGAAVVLPASFRNGVPSDVVVSAVAVRPLGAFLLNASASLVTTASSVNKSAELPDGTVGVEPEIY